MSSSVIGLKPVCVSLLSSSLCRASSIQSQASELQELEARLQAAERKKQEVSRQGLGLQSKLKDANYCLYLTPQLEARGVRI